LKRVLIDANVILRLVTNDPPKFAERAQSILERAENGEYTLELQPFIIAECIYVLARVYKVARADIAATLERVCNNIGLTVVEEDIVRMALRLYSSSSLDFADAYLIATANIRNLEIASFDDDIRKQGVTIIAS
jgi:predicted nucleic acid-binding protein